MFKKIEVNKFTLESVHDLLNKKSFSTQFFATAIPSEGHQNMTEDFTQLSVTRNKIMTAQYECYQKIMQDPIHRKEGKDYCLIKFYKGKWSTDVITVVQDPSVILISSLGSNHFSGCSCICTAFQKCHFGIHEDKVICYITCPQHHFLYNTKLLFLMR